MQTQRRAGARANVLSRRSLLPLAAVLAAFATFGLTATSALADNTITVPCAGNPAATGGTPPGPQSGPAGLISAINTANGKPTGTKTTINVQNGCAYDFTQLYPTESSDGPSALPPITSTIVINGQGGPDEPAIIMRSAARDSSGAPAPAFRLIDVASNGNLTLNSIQVTNGLTPDGSSGMSGGPGGNGGGIFSSGVLTLQDSVVSGNATGNGGTGTTGTGGKGGDGGGIYINSGSLTTNGGDTVSGNVTGNGGSSTGGTGGNGGNGGGIATAAGSDNLQDNTTLSSNSTGNGGSSTGGTGGNGGNGGSLYSAGSATVTIHGGNTNVEQSNTGTGGSGGTMSGKAGDGGGVFTSSTGMVSTDGTLFTENVAGDPAQSTSSSTPPPSGNGGGLAAEKGGHVTLHNGSFTWNVAANGGAFYQDGTSSVTLSGGTTFSNNTGNNAGGVCTTPAFCKTN